MMPWRDRAGRLSWLKLVTFVALFLPPAWIAFLWQQGDLAPRPIEEAIHLTGLWAARILLLSLAVTPLRSVLRWGEAMRLRRMIGVAAFAYVALHLLLYAADMKWDVGVVVSEIALRFYLTIGFVALLILAALAATSFDRAIRALGGARWRLLHRLAYLAGGLAMIHAILQTKVDTSEAMLMSGLFVWLMAWRVARPRGWVGLAALAGFAALATAGIEAAWFAFGTGVDATRVLAANLDVIFGPRPAVWVGIAGLAAVAAALLRRDTRARPTLA